MPRALTSTVAKKMRAAYHDPDALGAEATLDALARSLEKKHPGAAGSLPEGLFDTLTVSRLGVPSTLARTLRSTNAVESMIEICRDHSTNVKRWRERADGAAVVRRRHGRGVQAESSGTRVDHRRRSSTFAVITRLI